MTAGTVTDYVEGGSTHQSNATGNKVFIHDGAAGYVYGGNANEGNATENAVTITGGTVNGASGGSALKGNATGNTVTISGGTVDSDVFGGSADQGNATGNTVTITGGTVKLDVLGGSAYEGNATGNTVTLAGGAVTGAVYGGSCYHSSGTCDDITGNTLAVLAKGMTVGGDVFNFDTLNFDLATVGANDTVLEVAGGADFSKVTSANFSFNLADGAALKPGDKIYLIKADTLDIPSLPTSVTVCGHDFVLHADANTLTATVKGATPAPYSGGDSSSPTLGELGLLLSGIALAGAAAPALRRREKRSKKL